MTPRTRRDGEFCWINILTRKPADAREFFVRVLGWEFTARPPIGYGIKVGGRNIGGFWDTVSPQTPSGTPAMMGVMVKVADADAMAERVKALGGKAQPAFDIPNAGRMAVCHDPNGAQFDLWQPTTMPGTDVDATLHGAPSWWESMTTDVAVATTFYEALFGWTSEVTNNTGAPYTVFKQGNDMVAGMMEIRPEMGGQTPVWGVYFTVSDVHLAAKTARDLGGTLCVPVMDIPGVGPMCGITSPGGVTFYAFTPTAG